MKHYGRKSRAPPPLARHHNGLTTLVWAVNVLLTVDNSVREASIFRQLGLQTSNALPLSFPSLSDGRDANFCISTLPLAFALTP